MGNPRDAAGETGLHKFAKQVLNERLVMRLPAHSVTESGEVEVVVPPGPFEFENAILERRAGKIVPDVVLVRGSRRLIVEFMVTHACGPDKIDIIRELDIGAVEIDLSPYRGMRLRDLADQILFEAGRTWLHNPKTSAARDRARKRAAEKAAAIAKQVKSLARQYEHRSPARADGNGKAEVAIRRDGLGSFIDLDVKGSGCFSVPLAEWQATVLQMLLNLKAQDLGEGEIYLNLEDRGWMVPRFMEITREVAVALRATVSTFEVPVRAVRDYLKQLHDRGLLSKSADDGWRPSGSLTKIVGDARELRNRPAKRFDEIEKCVTDALKGLPEDESVSFDLDAWSRQPFPGRAYTLREALHFDEPAWRTLRSELVNLPGQIDLLPKPDLDLLGLPLAAELSRALATRAQEHAAREEALRKKAQAAADGRVASFKAWAWQSIGALADEWLAAPNQSLEGRIPVEVAVISEAEYVRAERALEKRIREYLRCQAQAQAKAAAQYDVEKVAKSTLGDERAKLWMRNFHPDLKARPEEFAIDEGTAKRCLELLQPKKRR